MLLHIPAVLTADELSAIRAGLQGADWQGGQVTAAPALGDIVQAALARNPLFFAASLPIRSMPPLFQRCGEGESHPPDANAALRMAPSGAITLRADIAATLFLSDANEYEGGELMVDESYGEHEVKLEAGDLAVYAAASRRRLAPVTRGVRLTAVFWTQSMVRDDLQRGMLFDLDRTIEALRARIGDCEETISLTSHYHNLLRHWAQT